MPRMHESTEIILQAGHPDAWTEVTDLRDQKAVLISVLKDIKTRCEDAHDSELMRGMIIDQIDDALKTLEG